jgi:hypothetical protein
MLCYAHPNGQADPSNSRLIYLIHKTEVRFVLHARTKEGSRNSWKWGFPALQLEDCVTCRQDYKSLVKLAIWEPQCWRKGWCRKGPQIKFLDAHLFTELSHGLLHPPYPVLACSWVQAHWLGPFSLSLQVYNTLKHATSSGQLMPKSTWPTLDRVPGYVATRLATRMIFTQELKPSYKGRDRHRPGLQSPTADANATTRLVQQERSINP